MVAQITLSHDHRSRIVDCNYQNLCIEQWTGAESILTSQKQFHRTKDLSFDLMCTDMPLNMPSDRHMPLDMPLDMPLAFNVAHCHCHY